MNTLLLDLRYALRLLSRQRGFALMSILTLALGIGANSAIFAVVHGVLYRDLPFSEPDRVVAVSKTTPASAADNLPAADYMDLRGASRSFEALAAYRMDIFDLSTSNGEPERIPGAQVAPSFFDVFQVPAVAGRTFSASRDNTRDARLVVLSHGLWQRRFAGEPKVVGSTVRINRQLCTVVGVMPATFAFPGDAEAWLSSVDPVPQPPLSVDGDLLSNRRVHYFTAVGRLARGVTLPQANSELAGIGKSLAQRFPETNEGESFAATPLRDLLTQDARTGLFILLGAVGFVLLVACANVAGLVLARATGRAQELAIRGALGAGRSRLVRQLLIESLVVGIIGSVLGLLVASWSLDGLLTLAPDDFPRLREVGLDTTVTLFTLGLGLVTALLFGTLPALHASRVEITPVLRQGESRIAGRRSGRAMSALVVAEVAIGLVLTVGAGLMVTTLLRLQSVDLGYRPDRVVRVPLPIPKTRYATSDQQAAFYTSVVSRLQANPALKVAAGFPLPQSTASATAGLIVEGRSTATDSERPVASLTFVTPGYFSVLGIPLRTGRDFDAHDAGQAPKVSVVSETAAKRLWPGENPIGKRFSLGEDDAANWVTVVGVVGDIRHAAVSADPAIMLYIPVTQMGLPLMSLVVRSDLGAADVAAAVRGVVRQVDTEIPVGDVADFSAVITRSIGASRLRAILLSGFSAVALLLAAIGVYGLLAYGVSQRTREIGIRLALGARPGQLFWEVVAGGMRLACVGIALGVAAALALSRVLASQVFAVGVADPVTFVSVSVILAVVALVACVLPARRVLRVDPVTALQ